MSNLLVDRIPARCYNPAMMRYTVILETEEGGGFHAFMPALHGCHSQGDSRIVIPLHAGKSVKPKTLSGTVRDMGLTMDEFRSLL